MRRARWLLGAMVLAGTACAGDVGPGSDPFTPTDPDGPEEPQVGFRVENVTPVPSDTTVDVRTPVVVTFSQPLDSASVHGALVVSDGERTVRGEAALDGPTVLRFTPATPLEPGVELTVQLASSVRAGDGSALDSALHWSFRTAGAVLGTPDPERFSFLVSFLAHDSLRGRGSGTSDEERAAQDIARDLESSGLVPFGGRWLHPFTANSWQTPPETVQSRNVLGVVPGSGELAGEWVVVGAHYDHLGFVERSDGTLSIYHGADDNASGTALVMELARLYASRIPGGSGEARRAVLFALWGSEERGLLGSCSFVDSGILPADRVAAVFNFDMVGRLGGGPLRVPVAEPDSLWWGKLADANRGGIPLDDRPGCTSCSDHGCFLSAGRPVVWFYTGTHEDYHKPTDVAEKVDTEGLAGIAGLALRTLWRAAVEGG